MPSSPFPRGRCLCLFCRFRVFSLWRSAKIGRQRQRTLPNSRVSLSYDTFRLKEAEEGEHESSAIKCVTLSPSPLASDNAMREISPRLDKERRGRVRQISISGISYIVMFEYFCNSESRVHVFCISEYRDVQDPSSASFARDRPLETP